MNGDLSVYEYFLQALESIRNYIFDFSENTIRHLTVFVLLLVGYFLIKMAVRQYRVNRASKKIGFKTGIWGTRGKSGTTRKQAALFNALGYDVFAKTTGSETCMLHAGPGQNLEEILLYRPGDRATIWEQHRMTQTAADLNSEVMVWECMALNPEFADIIQHDWGKDDAALLTNTHPDHENIQGPAGIDVARVMTEFIPRRSKLFTAENVMRPILEESSRHKGTDFYDVDWKESDLIPDDVLARFPYRVNSNNVALALKTLDYLEADRAFAMKEIADKIVPDIGVLKSYFVEYADRRLEFINGMAANDRLSCLANRRAVGIDRHDPVENPGTWIVTVINNRYDRIERSKDFAEIIVNDFPAHKHFFIGTNLNGMKGYVELELKKRLRRENLFDDSDYAGLSNRELRQKIHQKLEEKPAEMKIDGRSLDSVKIKLENMLKGLKVPETEIPAVLAFLDSPDSVILNKSQFLSALHGIPGSSEHADKIHETITHDLKIFSLINRFRNEADEKLQHNDASQKSAGSVPEKSLDQLNAGYRKLLKTLFLDTLIFISDFAIPGDAVVKEIVEKSPPGFHIRIMGLQNIKKTGFDFALRWISLEKVKNITKQLNAEDEEIRRSAVEKLSRYEEYGILDAPLALAALKKALNEPENDSPEMIQQIRDAIARVKLQKHQAEKRATGKEQKALQNFMTSFFGRINELGKDRKRKKESSRIMYRLVSGEISHEKAAYLMKKLVYKVNRESVKV